MRFVPGHPELRRLPSRHRFALFRLAALIGLSASVRRGLGEPRRDLLLFVDRDQNAAETYAVAIWVAGTAVAYLAWWMSFAIPLTPAFVLAVPAAALVLELPMFVVGAIVVPLWNRVSGSRREVNQTLNSKVLMSLLLALSAYCASGTPVWVRAVAWQFFAVTALNAAAAVVVFLLRGHIDALEASVGGASSAG